MSDEIAMELLNQPVESLETVLARIGAAIEAGETAGCLTRIMPNGKRYVVIDWEFYKQELETAKKKALARRTPTPADAGGLEMSSAPKDGSYILAEVAENDSTHLTYHAGRKFVIRHEGKTDSGYDLGWAVYPGYGGAPDWFFSRWWALPLASPLSRGAEEVEALGEALFALSDRLRISGFLEKDTNHEAYERVVAAFQASMGRKGA